MTNVTQAKLELVNFLKNNKEGENENEDTAEENFVPLFDKYLNLSYTTKQNSANSHLAEYDSPDGVVSNALEAVKKLVKETINILKNNKKLHAKIISAIENLLNQALDKKEPIWIDITKDTVEILKKEV